MGCETIHDLHVDIVLSYGLEELIHSHFVRFTLCLTPWHQDGGAVGNREGGGGLQIIAHLDLYLSQTSQSGERLIYNLN